MRCLPVPAFHDRAQTLISKPICVVHCQAPCPNVRSGKETDMERQQVLDKAFDNVCFPTEEFHPSMTYGLGNSVSASVEPLLGHALNRINAWLWPQLAKFQPGDQIQLGDMSIQMKDDSPASRRELSSKAFIATIEDRQWRFTWSASETSEPFLSVAADAESYFASGYCEFKKGIDGPSFGRITGKGGDVRSMFEFIGHCARLMPPEILSIRENTVSPQWEFDDFAMIVDHEGGLGASLSSDLYEMAEQKACRIIADWAGPHAQFLFDFLMDKELKWGDSYASHHDRCNQVFAIDAGVGRGAYFHQTFPGDSDGERFLTWFDRDPDGEIAQLSIYAIPGGADGMAIVKAFHEGDMPSASVVHDFVTGKTMLADAVKGYDHLANSTIYLGYDARMAEDSDPRRESGSFERLTGFVDLGEAGALYQNAASSCQGSKN